MHRGEPMLSDISRFIKAIYLNILFILYSSVPLKSEAPILAFMASDPFD